MQSALKWVEARAIKTFIDYLDCSKSTARQPSNIAFDEVMELIDEAAAHLKKELFEEIAGKIALTQIT